MKLYRILGTRGRVTIPLVLRQKVGFVPNVVLSFAYQDSCSVLVRREMLYNDDCRDAARRDGNGVTLLEFLSSLSEAEQHTALVHLSVLWAERQGQKGNDGSV